MTDSNSLVPPAPGTEAPTLAKGDRDEMVRQAKLDVASATVDSVARLWASRCLEYDAALSAATARAESVDAACLEVCPDNSPAVVDVIDEDVGRYVVVNENGDPLIDTDDPAEVIRELSSIWGRVSERLEQSQAENAALRARAERAEEELAAVFRECIEGEEAKLPEAPLAKRAAWSVLRLKARVAGAEARTKMAAELLSALVDDEPWVCSWC